MSRPSTRADIESQPELEPEPVEYLKGFADVSEYIGSDRDLVIFRRFDVLGARILLQLQAQLLLLEERLKSYDKEDKEFIQKHWKGNDVKEIRPPNVALDALLVAKDWAAFASRAKGGVHDGLGKNGREEDHYKKRMETVVEIQTVLKQYRM